MTTYRATLPPRPSRVAALPLDARGYPTPWFVAVVNGEPDFRLGDARKLIRAVRERRCWICGQPLGRFTVFAVGPTCTVNRISAEPPCHLDCAEYAVQACPFMLLPAAQRRDGGLPEDAGHAGHMIRRNPGVMALWISREVAIVRDPERGILFGLRKPEAVTWWAQGRSATREEVRDAFFAGLDLLRESCADDDERRQLEDRAAKAVALWPAEAA